MQALRKPIVQPPATPADSSAQGEEWTGPRLPAAEAAALSPALALREHLAARLEELTGQAGPTESTETVETKLPVPVRVTLIVGLSLSLWAALYLAIAAIL